MPMIEKVNVELSSDVAIQMMLSKYANTKNDYKAAFEGECEGHRVLVSYSGPSKEYSILQASYLLGMAIGSQGGVSMENWPINYARVKGVPLLGWTRLWVIPTSYELANSDTYVSMYKFAYELGKKAGVDPSSVLSKNSYKRTRRC